MPNKKISQLNSVEQLFGDEKLLITQSGANKTSTVPVLGTKLNSDVGAAVSGLNSQNIGFSGNARASITGIGSDLAASIGALHRSPNAITSMFVYDTSKDSDGGAWTEKCQHTSWYNEAINGKWLGAQESETQARFVGAMLGPELVTNGDFSSGTSGWVTGANLSVSVMAGQAQVTRNGAITATAAFQNAVTVTVGKTYIVKIDVTVNNGAARNITNDPGTSFTGAANFIGTGTFTFIITATDTKIRINLWTNDGSTSTFDNISVREVTATTTQSGDYFQLTTDGKFYRLWKNLRTNGNVFSGAITTNEIDPFGGTTASSFGRVTSRIDLASQAYSSASTHTNSFYLKYQGNRYVLAGLHTLDYLYGEVIFDLISETATITTSGKITSAGIRSIGNGYYRAYFTHTGSNASYSPYFITPDSASSRTATVTDPAQKFFVFGYQVEQGSTATDYETKAAGVGTTSEVFRGNKREFPKLSAIVAESSNVTIYDLTEPGRPMWMRFAAGGTDVQNFNWLLSAGGTVSSCAAINGTFGIGRTGTWARFVTFNFMVERCKALGGSGNSVDLKGLISNRNAGLGGTNVSPVLANDTIYSVAMTVLPDAPVDPVTGLQVPTIAVATASGVSVINHDGKVFSSNNIIYSTISIAIDSKSIYAGAGTYNWYTYFVNFPITSNFVFTQIPEQIGYSGNVEGIRTTVKEANVLTSLHNNPSALNYVTRHRLDKSNLKSLLSRISYSFNTGWASSAVKRTYLCSSSVEVISGANLCPSGSFDTDYSGFSATSKVDLSIVNGRLRMTGNATANGSGYSDLLFTFPTTIGKNYRIKGQMYPATASGLYMGDIGGYVNDSFSGEFIASSTSKTIGFRVLTSFQPGYYCEFDNISIVEIDTSKTDAFNAGKSAQVYGILTKSPVATNAQLVGYSGFSAANYLREPYSADLDFGTGEWSASAWVNVPVSLPSASFPVVGSELLTNGTFDTNTNGWTSGGAGTQTISATGGQLVISSIVGGWNFVSTQISTTVGKTYIFSADLISATGGTGEGAYLEVGTSVGNAGGISQATLATSGTKKAISFIATGSTTFIWFKTNAAINTNVVLDNASVKEASPSMLADRAYSSGAKLSLGVTPFGNLTATTFDGITTRTVTSPVTYNTNTWNKVRVNYTTDGKLALLINGVEVASATGTALLTLNNSNAVLTIGNNYAANAPFPGSLALVKFSATVPTTEQSQWMYEQEKAMFQPGAQVCLPSSNSVTDLTYDNLTDTWIAAQSTHISEWKGLVRTSYRKPASGSFDKLSAASGVRLMTRSSWGVDIEAQPVQLKKELFSSTDSQLNNQNTTTFDFDSTSTQTDFVLPVGYTAQAVFSAGVQIFEGSTGNKFTRLFDGFRETIRFGTAPGTNVWVKIRAVRAAQ